jgi:hypothetical protein
MRPSKPIKIIANTIYAIGATIVLLLVCIFLFGSREPVRPEAMLAFSWSEQAFIGLALGSVPMLLAGLFVYCCNNIKESPAKKRIFCLIFLPGFVCGICALFIAGVLAIGYFNMFVNWGN